MRSPLIYRHPLAADALVIFEGAVLESLAAYRQAHPASAESGGILMGYRRDKHIHVAALTAPQASDVRSRFRFFRQKTGHQALAMRAWEQSGRTMDYIGEWHTHPEERPRPSGLDLIEWKKICEVKKEPMIFLIQGMGEQVWVSVGQRRTIVNAVQVVDT